MDKFHSNKQGPAFKGTVQSASSLLSVAFAVSKGGATSYCVVF